MAKKIEYEVNIKTASAKANVDNLNESIKDTSKETKEVNNSVSGLTGALDKVTGGAVSKFKGLKSSIGGVTNGFKSMRVAIIGTGIGALVIAVVSLIQAFKSSEEGQNKLNKIMTIFGSIVGNLTDKVADLGEYIIGIFENPKAAWEDFKKAILENLKNRFEGLLNLIPNLGKAITQLFKGNFKEAGTIAANAVAKVTLGVDDIVGKTKEAIQATKDFVKEIEQEAKVAGKIADMRAKADKQERQLLTERAEANRRIAELREIAADKENVSVQERLEALREAGRVNDEIAQKEIETARLRFEAKKRENELTKSTKEDLDEQAQLEARLIELETARITKQKTLTAEITTALREEEAERKRIESEQEARRKQEEADAVAKAKADEERRKQEAKQVAELEKFKRQQRVDTLNNLISIAGAETKVGKALFVAKQVLALKEMIAEAKKTITFSTLAAARSSAAIAEGTAQTAKIGFPQNIPMLIGYAAQAVGIIGAIRSATSSAKNIAGRFGGGGSVRIQSPNTPTASQPAQFNTVGSSGINQLADSITGKPIKAYVVSSDVTSAQSLDRNKIETAGI